MVGLWSYRSHIFRALSKTYEQMWLRCDVCRRYAACLVNGASRTGLPRHTRPLSQYVLKRSHLAGCHLQQTAALLWGPHA
jgi:hypothetical protein